MWAVFQLFHRQFAGRISKKRYGHERPPNTKLIGKLKAKNSASIAVLYFTLTLRIESDSKEKHYEIRSKFSASVPFTYSPPLILKR